MRLIAFLFIAIIQVVYSKNSTQIQEKNVTHITPKLNYFSPLIFFNKELNSLIKKQRILRRLRSINKNLKERAKKEAFNYEDPYLNPERFTKSKLWRFFNYFKLQRKKRKQPRHPGRIINSFTFEKYLIFNHSDSVNANITNNTTLETNTTYYNNTNLNIQKNQTEELDDSKSTKCHSLNHISLCSNSATPGDYSGIPEILSPRRPKNIIIALVGVCSDELYYEAFKYTYYPFVSQLKMYGDQFRKDTGIIFPHPYLRKFKPIGSIKWSYRFAWADFSFGFRFKRVNLNQWMYSVDSILMLIDYLVQVEKYDPKRIFIYGYSQGGAMALSVTLRSKYILGGMISTASFLPERNMKKLQSMEPKITKEGLKTPMLLSYCNPDFIFPFRSGKKDVKYLKEVLKANVKYSLMLGEGHSCMTRYSMVYIDWIHNSILNYENNNSKPEKFTYALLDIYNNFQDYYNFGLSEEKKEDTN
ncbi:carboxylesterase [Cryptosporidium ubiquitum]|uniref:Carboxylesterase n=1 Tax=Cryptosporidium ubiquitum TaxID=857276 RepID=A0A1J4MAJ8_9CRYT|nr:carboxylesterase [Cryptosporidium ubiquitum]OII71249.1 carboxylesterase [Cryptosporidium ubiquitum]